MKKGFTLIELLVVISIIAILSTVGLNTFSGIQSRARDSVRKNDLNQLAQALEIYLQKNGKYVLSTGDCQEGNASSTFYDEIQNYVNSVPKDPKTADPYCYQALDDGLNYKLYAKLENCPAGETIPDINCQTARYNFVASSEEFIAALPSTAPYSYPSPASPASPYAYPTPLEYPTPAQPAPAPAAPAALCNEFDIEGFQRSGVYDPGQYLIVQPKLTSSTSYSKIEVYQYQYPHPIAKPFAQANWQLLGTITRTPQYEGTTIVGYEVSGPERVCVVRSERGRCREYSGAVAWNTPAYPGVYYLGMEVYDQGGVKIAGFSTANNKNCTESIGVKRTYNDTCEEDELVYPANARTLISGNKVMLQWQNTTNGSRNDHASAYVSSQPGLTTSLENRVVSRLKSGSGTAHDLFNLAVGNKFYKVSAFGSGGEGPATTDQAGVNFEKRQCNLIYGPPGSINNLSIQGSTLNWQYNGTFSSLQGWYLKRSDGLRFDIPQSEVTTRTRCPAWYMWWNTCATWNPPSPIPAGTYTVQSYGRCGGELGGESNSVTVSAPRVCLRSGDDECEEWGSPNLTPTPKSIPSNITAGAGTDSIDVSWQYPSSRVCVSSGDEGCEQWSTSEEQGFHVYRSNEPLDLTKSSPGQNFVSYQYGYFPNLPSGKHYLAVKVENACGEGWSNYVPVDIP